MIRKTVVTAAGLGTRLLPATMELPKEMFPFCVYNSHGAPCAKPMIQLVFESLFNHGLRNFCFVVGRRRRAVEDFFTEDHGLFSLLSRTSNGEAEQIREFFEMLSSSQLSFIRQPEPLGFGDAILKSRHFVGRDDFLLHTGDNLILSSDNSHLRRLEAAFREHDASIACLLDLAEHPQQYGVITGEELKDGCVLIDSAEEKPVKPKSNTAVVAVYAFKPAVFEYLKEARSRVRPEKELEYAIGRMLNEGHTFVGVRLVGDEKRIDIGNPLSYRAAMDSVLDRSVPVKFA